MITRLASSQLAGPLPGPLSSPLPSQLIGLWGSSLPGLFIGLLSTFLLAGCTDTAKLVVSQEPTSVNVLADFRAPQLQTPADALADDFNLAESQSQALTATEVVIAVRGTPPPEDTKVSAQASGVFSEQGVNEHLFLLTQGLPYASASKDAKPSSSMIALFRANSTESSTLQLHTQFVPRGNYRSIAAIADTNADDIDDVLLTRHDYRMGVLTVSADLFSFADGKRELLAAFERVYVNSCESGTGERQIVAQRLSYEEPEAEAAEGTRQVVENAAVLIETFTESCPTSKSN